MKIFELFLYIQDQYKAYRMDFLTQLFVSFCRAFMFLDCNQESCEASGETDLF